MNYLEIINKCLLEINYKQVNTLSELVKNDHKKIKHIINIINKEISNLELWNFLLRRCSITLNPNETEIQNPINGRILYVIIDGKEYTYTENFEPFLLGKEHGEKYSCLNSKLLFPKFNEQKTVDIVYYTNCCVVDENGNEKTDFEYATDSTLLPMPFGEQLLIYGTCLRLKANPQYIKFSYWMSMYKEALLNLKSKSLTYAKDFPSVRLFRH